MFNLIATCPDESKEVLRNELEALGCQEIVPEYKAIRFVATEEQFYRAHLCLATASNIMRVMKEGIPSGDAKILQVSASRLPWETWFDVNRPYIIDANQTDRGPGYLSSNDLSKSVRLAIEDRFQHKVGKKPVVDLKEPQVRVVVYSRGNRVTISLNTTGKAMHKRGYKDKDHPAPLKETLAAALLRSAGYDGSQVLFDPMCGSGSLVIEAAYIALGKAPLIHRAKGDFMFENLEFFNSEMWRQIQQECRDEKLATPPQPIFAADVENSYVAMARNHALRARVERYIQFSTADFLHTPPPAEKGLMICNLPYGERMSAHELDDLGLFYKEIGDHLKKNYSGWRIALFVADAAPVKMIGLRPTGKFRFLNGAIPCRLMMFDMFQGRRNEHLAQTKQNSSEFSRVSPEL